MNFLNKIIICFITFNIMCLQALAYDIDTSVDDEIRKKYNPNKIEEDLLPPLPNVLKNTTTGTTKPAIKQTLQEIQEPIAKPSVQQKLYTGKSISLRKGTKFSVRSATNISDKNRPGSRLTFKTQREIKTKFFTIPAQTQFKGEIIDSHTPQLTGNGGLIVIKVDSMVLNGNTQYINASITKANHKKIFFNNIKGARKYLKNLWNSINPGKKFFNKMMNVTVRLANDGASIILTPFSLASGVIVIGANTLLSPVFAIFSKGGSIYLPAGTAFEIKLLEDTVVYY